MKPNFTRECTRTVSALVSASLFFLAPVVFAQLEFVPSGQPHAVFGGRTSVVQVVLRNPDPRAVETVLKARLFQLTSATRVPVCQIEFSKPLTVLAGQTVLECVPLRFPAVRATTRFEARWLDRAGISVGLTLVTVHPTNLLARLAEVTGETPPGIFDPHQQLTPLLRALNVDFDDLTAGERLTTWRGRLAILGPWDTIQPLPSDLGKRATSLTARHVHTLLFTHPEDTAANDRASSPLRDVVLVRELGPHRLVTAPSALVAGLAMNPLAQEKLLELARLAVTADLPHTEIQP